MTLLDALRALDTPTEPKDGDCLIWAPRVTAHLVAEGLPATTVQVVATRHVFGVEAMLFIHQATKLGHLIIDTTARQFHRKLPLLWVADEPDYIRRLVKMTEAEEVRITELTSQPQPEGQP